MKKGQIHRELKEFMESNKEAKDWFLSRPPNIQDAIKQCPPYFEYRIKGAGPAFGPIYSYEENDNGPVTVKINLMYNTTMPRTVFGVSLENLERVKEE